MCEITTKLEKQVIIIIIINTIIIMLIITEKWALQKINNEKRTFSNM
jgi:hypothetical protein